MDGKTTAPIDPAAVDAALAPFGRSRTLPATAYTSEELFAWERRHFFEDSWVCAGRGSDVGEPGSQMAVEVGAEGVLLVRDGDGILRGFSNVCRHRGHQLLQTGRCAASKAIACPYHGWVYDLDGALRGAASFHDVPGFDRADFPPAVAGFFYDADPAYRQVGVRRANLISTGMWDDPGEYDATYRNVDAWGSRRLSPPGVVVDGVVRTTKLSQINLGIEEFVDHSFYEPWNGGHLQAEAPDGSPLSPYHPWNKRTIPRPERRSWKERYSWSTAPRWDREPMESGPLARLWMTARAGRIDTVGITAQEYGYSVSGRNHDSHRVAGGCAGSGAASIIRRRTYHLRESRASRRSECGGTLGKARRL